MDKKSVGGLGKGDKMRLSSKALVAIILLLTSSLPFPQTSLLFFLPAPKPINLIDHSLWAMLGGFNQMD